MPNVEHPHTYHSEKMKNCVADLEAKGHEPGSAHAICYSSLGEEANKLEKSADTDEPCPICEEIAKAVKERTGSGSRFIEKDSKQRYTLGVVYEPDELDTDEEFTTADEIEKAAWEFARYLQAKTPIAKLGLTLVETLVKDKEATVDVTDFVDALEQIEKRGVNDMHMVNLEDSEIVESYIAPVDMQINGEKVKKGTWLLGVVWSPAEFEKIESGERAGYSMGGRAKKAAA